jgi:hypothetical protein
VTSRGDPERREERGEIATRSSDTEDQDDLIQLVKLCAKPSGLFRPAKVSHQPEASLAWFEGDLGCEA